MAAFTHRNRAARTWRALPLCAVICGVLGVAASPAAASGATWLPQGSVSTNGPAVSDVQAVMDNQGDSLVVWIAGGNVEYNFRPAGGQNVFSGIQTISGAGSAAANLRVAMNQSGDAVAVWDDTETGDAYAASFSGTTFSFATTVAGNGTNAATTPDVAIDNSGNAEVVWIYNDGTQSILQAVYWPSGALLQSTQSLTTDLEQAAANPQVVFDANGDAVAAWQQSDGTDTLVNSAVQPAASTPTFGSTTALTTDPYGNAENLQLASTLASGQSGGVTAVWDNGIEIDDAYMPLSSTTFNATHGDVASGTAPAVAMDALGNAITVFQATSDLIDAAALEAGGTQQFGNPINISNSVPDTLANPQIATNANGETIAVWQDNTTDEIVAAVQTSFATTPAFGKPANASSAAASAPTNPTVALDSNGDGVAGWAQGSTPEALASGYDNGPQFPNVQIPSAPYADHAVTLSVNPTDVWQLLNTSTASWAFGDGGTATGNTDVTHTYFSTGNETVTFTISDQSGVSPQQPVSQSLTVGTQPAAVPGGLFQLDSPNDCVTGASWGCGTLLSGVSTGDAYQPAVSPDGRNVYFASLDGAVTEFSRNASRGALTSIGCFGQNGDGCIDPNEGSNGLSNPAGVAVSPDGKNVYVIGQNDDAVVTFSRNQSTGALTWQGCIGEGEGTSCDNNSGVGLDTPYGIVVSPDGHNVYVSSNGPGGELAEFDRNLNTGALTQSEAQGGCISGPAESGCGVTNATGMTHAIGISISPDGNNVYVEAGGVTNPPGDIAEFTRNASTDSLTELECIGRPEGGCSSNTTGTDIDGTEDMAISPDGRFAYVNSYSNGSIVELSRNTSTGALSQIECVTNNESGCATNNVTGLVNPLGVAISPDGANLYASGSSINSEVSFVRNPSTGALTQLASPFDCISVYSGICGQGGATGLVGARRLIVSPDGKNVYVAGQGSGAIAELSRSRADADLALSVSGASSTVTQGGSFAYTYTVTNNGPADVADPVLKVTLSSLVTGTTAVPSQGSCSGDTCSLGPIFGGATATVQVPVSAASLGTATTTATVSSELADPNTANNSVSSMTTIQTPPPSSLPPPTVGNTVNAYPVAGTVLVKLPGSNKFIPLSEARQLPMGTIIDARHGTIELVFAKRGGGTMEGQFFDGEFTFTQKKNYAVDVKLVGGGFSACTSTHSTRYGPIAVIARGRPRRSLWSNVHGNFTTSGRSASGSARGTEWFTKDTCPGTLIHVTTDKVLVLDFKTHKTTLIHAPHKIFVKG